MVGVIRCEKGIDWRRGGVCVANLNVKFKMLGSDTYIIVVRDKILALSGTRLAFSKMSHTAVWCCWIISFHFERFSIERFYSKFLFFKNGDVTLVLYLRKMCYK